VGEENKIKKLGWRMEKECPWKGMNVKEKGSHKEERL